MSQEAMGAQYGLSPEEEAELLGSVRGAMDMDYGVPPEAQMAPLVTEPRSRREADDRQYAYRLGLEEPAYLAGKISLAEAADIVQAREAHRYAAALTATTLPYDGVTPGLREKNEQKLRARGGVWAQDL